MTVSKRSGKYSYEEYNETYSTEPNEIHLAKLDKNGQVLIEDQMIAYQDFIGWPSFDINSKDEIQIIWYGGYWEFEYSPIFGDSIYINGSIYRINIDNNGNIIENTTKIVTGDEYTALSYIDDDTLAILWTNSTGTYLGIRRTTSSDEHLNDSVISAPYLYIFTILAITLAVVLIFIIIIKHQYYMQE